MACAIVPSADGRNAPSNLQDTPFRYHVCIVACEADADKKAEFTERLKEGGLVVFEENIDEGDVEKGIAMSQKVIVIVTRAFLEDASCTHQINRVREKADMINSDIVIVAINSDDVTNADLKQIGLSIPPFRPYHLKSQNFDYLKNLVADTPVQSTDVRPNIGAAMAYSYYYGYLSFILPGLKKRVSDSGFMKGLQGADPDVVENLNNRNMSRKFFIIIPESLCGLPSFHSLDESITDIGKIPFKVGRGGHPFKDYSTYVHKIEVLDRSRGGNKEYLFLGEIPTILINLYDMHEDGCEIPKRKRDLEIQQFFHYLETLLKNNPECKDRYTFIFHRDESRSNSQQIGDLIRHKIEEEISVEIREEYEPSSPSETSLNGGPGCPESPITPSRSINDMKTLQIEDTQLKAKYLYSPLKFYDLWVEKSEKVGKALVINNKKFTQDSGLTPRKGSEVDEASIVDLLNDMKFDHRTFRDQTGQEMWNLANHYAQDACHDNAKAFICVIMTHGTSGYLYGIDGRRVPIVKFMEVIGECRQLKGCPKIFIIEACQSISNTSPPATPNTTDTVPFNDDNDSSDAENRKCVTPCSADTLACFCTLPGKKAYRDPQSGTLYIQQLCKTITKNRKGMELERMLKVIARNVKTEYDRHDPHNAGKLIPNQLPFFIHTLDKCIAFTS